MDTSPSLVKFSSCTNLENNSQEFQMDTVLVESLICNTKRALNERDNGKKISLTTFSSLLEKCGICISQTLDSIKNIVEQSYSKQMCMDYLKDSAGVLQLLSNYIKKHVELLPFTCSDMKEFPITVGQIILLVFNHCKDSEVTYGSKLSSFEAVLKNLFHSCHELQITYLMILEKHFIFDLGDENEIDVLLLALNINLKIGEIVKNLDVKTMAEQWKAITSICEKYHNCLIDKGIYNECVQVLCMMTTNKINTALQNMNEDKIAVRALKVASFTIKILLKICTTLRNSTIKEALPLIDLLIFIHLHGATDMKLKKSLQFMNSLNTYVIQPSENLICELLVDKKIFLNLFQHNSNKKDEQLAFISIMVTAMKIIAQNPDMYDSMNKNIIIERIYDVLPHGHIWFHLPIKYNYTNESTYGLYEHLLVHTMRFAHTFNSEHYSCLERSMCEAILGIECYRALFFTDLWTLLARLSSRTLIMDQLVFLCKTYQQLEGIHSFYNSPQKVHLSQIISKLFYNLTCEEKIRFYKQFNVIEVNYELWIVIGVNNLPDGIRSDIEVEIMEECRRDLHKLVTSALQTSEMINLIRTMKLTASCVINDDSLNEYVVLAFTKTCNKHNERACIDYAKTLWFERLIEALASLTISMEHLFNDNISTVKVLHAILNLLQMDITEIKLLLIDLTCMIMKYVKPDAILSEILRNLFLENNDSVKHKFLTTLRKNFDNVRNIVERIVSEDAVIKEIWETWNENENTNYTELIDNLKAKIDYQFIHKCIKNDLDVNELKDSEKDIKNSSNFDFADIDTLFETETDEPETKKIKLDTDETAIIIRRLEEDVDLLLTVKENVDKEKIKNICDKLLNIIK